MRRFVIGSHHLLAHGLRDTLEFLTCKENIIDISAYVDDTDAEEQIAQVFASIAPEDEVIIMTDMLGGSVNQKFCPYMTEHRHLISGINLPSAAGGYVSNRRTDTSDCGRIQKPSDLCQ